MPSQPTQLTLGISLDDEARFENYYSGADNRKIIEALNGSEPYIYLFGPSGCGRTHLLQALCHAVGQAGGGALYLPLAERGQFGPDILEGVNRLALVAVDDLPLLAGEADWESALFTAFNLMKESGTRLAVTAHIPPRRLPLKLADLKSRLNSGLILQLQTLSDEDKRAMLRLRAEQRGMKLQAQVADYILRHAERDTRMLMEILNRLDADSLTHQRHLTIPLVRTILSNWGRGGR